MCRLKYLNVELILKSSCALLIRQQKKEHRMANISKSGAFTDRFGPPDGNHSTASLNHVVNNFLWS